LESHAREKGAGVKPNFRGTTINEREKTRGGRKIDRVSVDIAKKMLGAEKKKGGGIHLGEGPERTKEFKKPCL